MDTNFSSWILVTYDSFSFIINAILCDTNMALENISRKKAKSTAFSSTTSSRELWYISPPTVHISAMVTGGLKKMYENIKTKVPTQNTECLSKDYTDSIGHFDPQEDMQLLAKRYRFIAPLARGHTAVVIKAEDTFHDQKLVIIKVLRTQYYLIGGQEAEILRQLNSADLDEVIPIIRLRNLFRMGQHYCLVFDAYDHFPINFHFIQRGWKRQTSLKAIRTVVSRLLVALSFLHKQNIIHADLKPENLLLLKDESVSIDVRIADFGNSIRAVPDEIALYEDDFELQTIMYRAPEVLMGVGIGFGIDLWSVGCILAELYLHRPLFNGESNAEVLTNMVAILGPLPPEFAKGKFGKEYEKFTGVTLSYQEIISRLQEHLECTNFNFLQLLAGFLKYNPEDRLSPYDALSCSFLSHSFPLHHILNLEEEKASGTALLKKEDHDKFVNNGGHRYGVKQPCVQVQMDHPGSKDKKHGTTKFLQVQTQLNLAENAVKDVSYSSLTELQKFDLKVVNPVSQTVTLKNFKTVVENSPCLALQAQPNAKLKRLRKKIRKRKNKSDEKSKIHFQSSKCE